MSLVTFMCPATHQTLIPGMQPLDISLLNGKHSPTLQGPTEMLQRNLEKTSGQQQPLWD